MESFAEKLKETAGRVAGSWQNMNLNQKVLAGGGVLLILAAAIILLISSSRDTAYEVLYTKKMLPR